MLTAIIMIAAAYLVLACWPVSETPVSLVGSRVTACERVDLGP
jgi:hypothetical protein